MTMVSPKATAAPQLGFVRYTGIDGVARVAVADGSEGLHELAVAGMHELSLVPLSDLHDFIASRTGRKIDAEVRWEAPIDGATEVWASGVTYLRSRSAREEESQVADVYSRVYDADRPELFLKSIARRVVGNGDLIGIREDSAINVPEPELGVAVNAFGEVFAVTICNDVSSRTIEGENPLYLPQAKIYAGACAVGPWLVPIWEIGNVYDLDVSVDVDRSGANVWSATTSTSLLHRRIEELVEYLYRADWFPHGAILSTGTGVVPDLDFTLEEGDVVSITISGIGTLTNPVVRGKDPFRGVGRRA